MKKFLINGVLMSALLVMVAACGQKSGQTTDATEKTEVTASTESNEAAAPAKNVAELNTDELLKYYSELVDEFVALAPKAMSGDTKMTDRFSKVSNELADISSELQKRAKDLTPSQLKEMTETAKRMTSVISK